MHRKADVREQTRLLVLRIAGYEGFGGTQKLEGKGSVLLGLKKQTIQKNSFLRRPGVQDPASVLPTMRVLLPSAWWVPTAH